jgi:cytidyltransferase-like protein
MKVVAVSGYFDNIHEGHLSLFKEAKKLGDKLVVIIGRDDQLIGKKGFFFWPLKTRTEVIKSIKYVDEIFIAIDKDGTVNESLSALKPDIFANGGDRTPGKIPEEETCNKLGIKLAFNVGGADKMNSSSQIIQEGFERYTKTHSEERPWGHWKILTQGPGFKSKMLIVEPGQKLSLQSHKHRNEHWIVVKGQASVILNERDFDVCENESCYIPRNHKHQLINKTKNLLEVVEVATGDYLKEDDIVRYEDAYGRV